MRCSLTSFSRSLGIDHQGVHLFAQIADALFRLGHAASAFKFKRLCHNAYGEHAQIPGHTGYHRRCPGTRTAAHTGGDEHHIGAAHGRCNGIPAFFGSFGADFRMRTGPLFRR